MPHSSPHFSPKEPTPGLTPEPSSERDAREQRTPSRRSMITAAAWSVPVITVAAATPAAAASPVTETLTISLNQSVYSMHKLSKLCGVTATVALIGSRVTYPSGATVTFTLGSSYRSLSSQPDSSASDSDASTDISTDIDETLGEELEEIELTEAELAELGYPAETPLQSRTLFPAKFCFWLNRSSCSNWTNSLGRAVAEPICSSLGHGQTTLIATVHYKGKTASTSATVRIKTLFG